MDTITDYKIITDKMTTAELEAEIENFDFWKNNDDFKIHCYDTIQERDNKNFSAVSIDTTKIENSIEYTTEKMNIRSAIVSKMNKGTLYRIRNYSSCNLQNKDYNELQSFADQLNSNESNLTTFNKVSKQFINDFSSTGYFLRDDVINIITSIENKANSKKVINGLKSSMTDLISDACEYYKEILETTENTTSEIEKSIAPLPFDETAAIEEITAEQQIEIDSMFYTETAETIDIDDKNSIENTITWFESKTVQESAEQLFQKVETNYIFTDKNRTAAKTTSYFEKCIVLLFTVLTTLFNIFFEEKTVPQEQPTKNNGDIFLSDKKRTNKTKIKSRILKSVFNYSKKVKIRMQKLFKPDDKSMVVMEKMLNEAPKQYKKAVKLTLNNLAFDTREQYQDQLKDDLIIRNKGLPKKGTGYKPAVMAAPEKMKSVVGSHTDAMDNFSGWGAQEGTAAPKRKRLITDKARGGNRRRKATKRSRMNNKMANVSKIVGRSSQLNKTSRVLAYLSRKGKDGKRQAARYGDNDYFMTSESYLGGNLPKGVYKIKGGRMKNGRYFYTPKEDRDGSTFETMQYTPGSKSKLQPKRKQMLRKSYHSYVKSGRPDKRFRYNMYRQMEILNKK